MLPLKQPLTGPASGTLPPPPKAKRSLVRRVLSPLALLAVIFYGVSVPLGYASLRYRDFLVEAVPLGEQIGDLLDKYELDSGAKKQAESAAVRSATGAPAGGRKETELTRYAESRAKAEGWGLKKPDPEKAREDLQRKQEAATARIQAVAAEAKAKAAAQADKASDALHKAEGQVKNAVSGAVDKVKQAAPAAKATVEDVKKAVTPEKRVPTAPVVDEPKETLPVFAQRPRDVTADPVAPRKGAPKETYTGPPLPIGFEPAPGYELPRAPPTPKGEIKPATPPPAPLPLVAPAVKEATASEPMLGQLASTIDSLAKYVENTSDVVSSSAGGVLSAAQRDIQQLAERLDSIKKDEQVKLEQQLKKQAGEYSGLLLKAEKELVERLDTQEQDWRTAFEDERKKLVEAYKTKLNRELETQQEIIDQRLKEEVVAQGIELQRRWVQEVKTRVEQERGGRLAKLEELEGGIRKLEKVAKENEDTVGEAVRARKVFTAVRAVEHAVASGKPFDAELRALRKVLSSGSGSDADEKDDAPGAILAAALSTIPDNVASAGISSFPALSAQFHHAVAPQLRKVALLPEHGGLLAYLSSVVLSHVMFDKEGWSEGDDVVSTVARAKYWLENKDLDLAAREVNSLKGESERTRLGGFSRLSGSPAFVVLIRVADGTPLIYLRYS